jgi:hypothetical protein
MIPRSNVIPMSKRFFPGLLPIVGDERYEQIAERYLELYLTHDHPQNRNLEWHLTEGILPGLAFYQILRETGESQKSALTIIHRAFGRLFSENFNKFKKFGKLRFVYALLRAIIKPAMRRYPPAGWRIAWKQNDKNAIRFEMRSCFYFDVLLRYGAPELTAAFCRVDDLTYVNLFPNVVWQRTMTIARGNTYCDFCFLNNKALSESSRSAKCEKKIDDRRETI